MVQWRCSISYQHSVSTAGCLIDLVLCMVWAFDIGWTNSGQQWQILWLIWHGFTAGVFFCVHVAINVVIQELIRLRGNEQVRRLANGGRYRFLAGIVTNLIVPARRGLWGFLAAAVIGLSAAACRESLRALRCVVRRSISFSRYLWVMW